MVKTNSNYIELFNCEQTDLKKYKQILFSISQNKNLEIKTIGTLDNLEKDEIFLITPKIFKSVPTVLIAGGFHGEEPAGSWGILNFLTSFYNDFETNINISFLPIVNPSGFSKGKRTNDWGENPNSNFCHNISNDDTPSKEGVILVENIELIKKISSDGFISLHEDSDMRNFYLYTFERKIEPSNFSNMLKIAGANYFDIISDKTIDSIDVTNGLIYCNHDGSFEDYLFELGIPLTACTETPGKMDINKRIEANTAVIFAFLKYYLSKF